MLNIFLGEFLGTMFLVLLGNGIVANVIFKKTIGAQSGFLAIAVGWGLAVFAAVVIASEFKTGGHLNPAVTTMIWVKGGIGIEKAFVYYSSEFLGAIVGQLLVSLFYFRHIAEVENKDAVLSMHSTGPTHKSVGVNLFSEFMATVVLVTMAMLHGSSFLNADGSDETTKSILGFAGPLTMGLTVLGIVASLGGTTGAAINPARDLGPRLVYALMPYPGKVKNANWSYAWVPVVGPLLAGVLVGSLGRLMG